MKIEVDLKKKYFLFAVGLIILLGAIAFSLAQPNIFGHKASEISDWDKITIGQINASKICIANNCITSWSQVGGTGGASQWTTSGDNIYYNKTGGNVGIGISNPDEKLVVGGSISLGFGATSKGIYIYKNNNNNYAFIYPNNNGDIVFAAGTSGVQDRMRIGSDGNVVITGSLTLGGVTRNSWPTSSTDTRCDTPNTCNQVCIGNDCRTSWPSSSGGTAGVTSLNGLTGNLNIQAGTGISISSSGSTITISSTTPQSPTCTLKGVQYSVGAKVCSLSCTGSSGSY
ncbi:MAG: hypothetical protein N3D20_02950, partial [Candidatus Pacearchaeota archaeon]|nr:hypothetical protein [Candidatus Pacearchaeota archaeon]